MANVPSAQATSRPITADAARLVLRRMPGLASVVVMAVIGIGISIYLTTVHYAKVPLICSATGTVDCASVLKSPYGLVPGTSLPITFPGMLWFAVAGGIAGMVLLAAMRGTRPPAWWSTALKGWGIVGFLSIFYLIYAEIVKLHHICAWCTVIHTLVVATLIVAYMQDTTIPTLPLRKGAGKATAKPLSAIVAKPTNAAVKAPIAKSATPSRPLSAGTSRPLVGATGTARPASATTKAKAPVSAARKSR